METESEKRFDRSEAAGYLGVSIVTVDRALASRKLACFRIGRRVLIAQKHLDDFLRRCEQNVRGGKVHV